MTTCNPPVTRFAWLAGAAFSVMLLMHTGVAMAYFQPGPPSSDPNFEIDTAGNGANAQDEAFAGDDWQTVYKCYQGGDGYDAAACSALGGLNANLINTTGIMHDHPPASIYWKGGSKDISDIPNWEWQSGSVPDKDEILHAYAAAYGAGSNELIMYIGADRYSNDGDAMMGAWFFQDVVALVPNPAKPDQGKFSGQHKNGDILWVGRFSGGGVIAEMRVYKWDDPQLPNSNCSAANRIKGTKLCLVADGPGGGSSGYFASVNTSNQTAYWDYTPKQGTAGTFPYNSFMEGGINITQMLGGQTPCFTSFLLESRSSTEVNAQLKDFVLGRIDTCKIDVKKTCSPALAPDGASINDTFTIKVKNTGYAALDSVHFSDDRKPLPNPWDWTWSGSPDGEGWYTAATYTINTTIQGLTNTVTAIGKTTGGYETAPATDTVTCANVPVNPGLQVTKACDKAQLVVDNRGTPSNTEDDRLWVKLSHNIEVCNTGDVRLTVNTLNDRYNSMDHNITSLMSTTTLNPPGVGPSGSDCVSVSPSYYPNQPVGGGITTQYSSSSQCFAGVDTQHWADQVRASATPALGTGPVKAMGVQADCYLCPTCAAP